MRKMIATTTIAVGLALAPGLDAVHAQDSSAAEDDDNGEIGLIGLAGLLGLAGLAGLKRRDRNDGARYDTSRETGVSR
jgi:MYXO-CTERM domain-containing protein